MTSDENSNLPLHKGRKKTNKSLRTERAKTDDLLSKGLLQTQRNTDEVVSSIRAEADEARLQIRAEIDDNALPTSPGFGTTSKGSIAADNSLRQERHLSDEALESERSVMDSVLENERRENETVEANLFKTERLRTDKDLTEERIQIDEEVQRAVEELSEEQTAHIATRTALTTRDEFLAIVSHDLKNPLGSISMTAQLLLTSPLYASADQQIRQFIETMGRSAGEALRLIGDLLDMERIANGKLDLQIKGHNVFEIIKESLNAFQIPATTKGLSIGMADTEPDVMAMCDRDRITQVLSNLIGNAIKFSPHGGSIGLAAVLKKNDIQISVTDTGPGIPENMLKTIFERFWQIGKHDRRGLGLGLYISKMIVEAHKGRLWAESRIGKGSSFHFTLPTKPR